ncbi:hypothetical protein BpJC4_03720 [Weizmannia acidilactici]|uniref:hypothetical protein n=1 Tax=Weizmannia acidilactici TaxID=2607726 RepID=UPI00124DA449|nr:hypothetical protein [Weizmannia acidilactici]GER65901.1 hypothetical protein BpJC4_03720 [Weizmannia acidilactici]
MKAQKILISFLALLLLFLYMGATVHPVLAKEKRIIIHDRQTVVPENEKVENVIVLGDDATVSGYVRTAVIVINGNLDIKKSADIHGSVFVLGGNIRQEPGAKVTEHVISVNMNNKTLDSMIFAGMILLALWFFRLAASLVFIILTALFGVFTRKKIFSGMDPLYMRPGRLIITGFLMMLALTALSLLLTITVIGIPLVVLILLAIFVSFIAGMAFLSREVGSEFSVLKGRSEWLVLLTGATILIALCSIPLIGEVIFLLLSWYSLGLTVTWLYQKWKNRKNIRA